MINCQGCGQLIRDISELSEVGSLGLALRGRCPHCGGWVFCQDLWKKTKTIDKTHARRIRKSRKKQPKKRDIQTPEARENRLETVLASR